MKSPKTKKRIIIVDDNADIRNSVIDFFKLKGFDICGVESGLEFYNELSRKAFDLAIIDIGLPDQNGYVLSEYVRNNTKMGVIIMTANGEDQDRLQGYQAGADVYLTKPTGLMEIYYAANNLLDRIQNPVTSKSRHIRHTHWKLLVDSWLLESPLGARIQLTAKELRFIECITRTPGKPVSRALLLDTLGYDQNEYNSRAMDALVRRLRRKIESHNIHPTPIKTAYTSGYCFSSPVTIN